MHCGIGWKKTNVGKRAFVWGTMFFGRYSIPINLKLAHHNHPAPSPPSPQTPSELVESYLLHDRKSMYTPNTSTTLSEGMNLLPFHLRRDSYHCFEFRFATEDLWNNQLQHFYTYCCTVTCKPWCTYQHFLQSLTCYVSHLGLLFLL